jgi:hypothetical protein
MPAADALALNPRSRVIRWRPGTRLSYSNVGYGIAGRAIELATHEPFDVWLRREVLQPLGMRDADFRRTERLAARLAIGYSDPDTPAPFTPIAHRAAGSLLASATDLGKLVQFWLRRGDGTPIVSRAGLDRIERQGTMPYPRMDLEYGLGNYGDVAHPVFSRGHDGGLPGFVSTLRYFPELGVGYVLLLNATHSARAHRELRGLAFAYLTRDLVLPVAPAVAAQRALPSAEAYRFASPRHALLGFLERSLLAWRTTPTLQGVYVEPLIGWPHELERTQDGGYRIRGESGTSVRFLHDRDGTPIMIHHFMYAEATPWWLARVRLAALTLAFWLVLLAPLWGALTYAVNRARSRRVIAWDLVLGPAIAGLCLHALPRLFLEAARAQVLGEVHPWTIAVCATTIVFGLASLASVIAAIRWQRRADRPALWRRFVPSAMALSAGGLALWFAANGIIGLRTWAW